MKKIIICILILSVIFNVACQSNNKHELNTEPLEELSVEALSKNRDIIEKSEAISDLIVDLYGIDDAVTLLFNDTAIVGIVLARDSKLDEEMMETIKTLISEKYESVNHVKISKKEKIFDQLNNIVLDLLNNKPYDDYVLEISKILEKVDKEK